MDLPTILLLMVVAFVQNMAFTLTSRSRNSSDPSYHRYAAWGSNGIWFMCYTLIWKSLWQAIMEGRWWEVAFVGLIYTIATAEGSVLMMKILIKREKGKRRVGSYDT